MKSKNKQIKKILKTVFIFTLIFSWIFSGWPQVFNFPSEIEKAEAETETGRPQGHGGGLTETTSPGNAYDSSGNTTQSDTNYAANVSSEATFYNWSAAGQTYTELFLKVEYEAEAATGSDTYEIQYSVNNTSGQCDSTTWTDIVSSTSAAAADHTVVSATLSASQNLTQICVRLNIAKSGGPDNKHVFIEDIRTEGTYTPVVTTTLTNGASEPSSVTIAPGTGITDLDNFTLYTSADTDTVTAAVVTLGPANAYDNIHQVDITDTSNVAQCTAVTSLSSNIVSFPTSTCNISVTTTDTTYKVRITPKAHGDMPVVPGASYVTTGTVTGFTSTNTQSGSDSGSAEITVDNLSPNGADPTSGSAGNAQVTLNWTTSNSSDFNTTSGSVIYRWAAGSAGSEVPDEGSTPSIGSTNGTATAACVVSSAASTPLSKIDGSGGSAECTTAVLTNGQSYSYKVFQKDNNGNYDTSVTFTGSPFIPSANSPPSISISQPDGASDTVVVGTSYDITYTLSDSDDIVTAAFYYDTDNTGLNGVAITGPCAAAAEGSGVTCAWNTTGMTPGSYYVYGITDDGTNPAENAYSSGQITINAQSLTFSISNSAIDFGTLGAIAARFATTNASSGGSTTETVAHTLVASTNVSGGYIITVEGATLTHSVNGSFAVDAITSTAVDVTLGGSIGTEQFGLRLTKSGTGSITSPYNGSANFYIYDGTVSSASQIASGTGDGTSTTFSVYSAANIAANTEAGIYETALTYICTAAF